MTRICAARDCSEPVVGPPQKLFHAPNCKLREHRAKKAEGHQPIGPRPKSEPLIGARVRPVPLPRPMRVGYADPVYPGKGHLYPEGEEIDHLQLITWLCATFPDGWALSTSSEALELVLSLCPSGCRVGSWRRQWKPYLERSRSWEPVIFCGGRRQPQVCVPDSIDVQVPRDWTLPGRKPDLFFHWLLCMLGVERRDSFVDVFPGSGAGDRAFAGYPGPRAAAETLRAAGALGDAAVRYVVDLSASCPSCSSTKRWRLPVPSPTIRPALLRCPCGCPMNLAVGAEVPSSAALPRPFLKWVGGKGQLLGELRKTTARCEGRYFEPFVGGGALFFDLAPARAVLGDLNPELIGCYEAVRDDLEAVIDELMAHVYGRAHYYAVRDASTEKLSPAARAARMIYLNRAGFNGLYRVSAAGHFNVPLGRYTNPLLVDVENLSCCSEALQGAELRCGSFEQVLSDAGAGDLAYLDPPYVPLSSTASFTGYQAGGFGPDDQHRLAGQLVDLDRRGVGFTLSNSDAPGLESFYRRISPRFRVRRVTARRSVGPTTASRADVGELLITNQRKTA